MKPGKTIRSKSTIQISWVWISGISFLLCFLASAILIFFGNELDRLGITGNIYYIILIPLGFSSAAFLAGAMKSYASFKSNEILSYGKLNLSGPIVIFALVVGGGFIMPGLNKKEKFDLKMHVIGGDVRPGTLNSGAVILYIGKFTRQENIHNGEVIFADIPEGYNNKKGKVALILDNYQLADPEEITILKNEDSVVNINVTRTQQSLATNVRGSIMNEKNEPVKNAFLNFSSGLATCYTDKNGDFELTVPIAPGQKSQLKISMNQMIVFNQEVILSSTIPVNLSLSSKP